MFSIKRPTVFAHRPVRTVKKLISVLVLVLVFTFASLQKSGLINNNNNNNNDNNNIITKTIIIIIFIQGVHFTKSDIHCGPVKQ